MSSTDGSSSSDGGRASSSPNASSSSDESSSDDSSLTAPEEVRLETDREAVVSLDNVHKTYLLGVEGVPALRGVSVDIHQGEFVMILGTSGGGKTSMLNVIGTIDKPTKGKLSICGRYITPRTTDAELAAIRLTKLGFVFQTFNLLSNMTALENVTLPMTLKGTSPSERKARAEMLLKRMGMGERLGHFPNMMSGGEQQRVTIARALANKPEILLLDEPTGDLDGRNSEIVMKLLTELNREEGITLIMVTHDPNLKQYAERVIHLRDGKISRIEVVNAMKRRAALKELAATAGLDKKTKDRYKERMARRTARGLGDDESDSDDSGDGDALAGESDGALVTEYRAATDYKMLAHAQAARKAQAKERKKNKKNKSAKRRSDKGKTRVESDDGGRHISPLPAVL